MSNKTVNRIKAFFVKAIYKTLAVAAVGIIGVSPLVIGWCCL